MLKMLKSTKKSYIDITPETHTCHCVHWNYVGQNKNNPILRNHFLRFINLKLHVQEVPRNYQDVELLSCMGTKELIAKWKEIP